MTDGAIAFTTGLHPRQVGRHVAALEDIPWWRIIHADGTPPPATAGPPPPCSRRRTSPSAADGWTSAPCSTAPPRPAPAPATTQEAPHDHDQLALAHPGHGPDRRAAAAELCAAERTLAADELRLQPRRGRHPRRALRRARR
ncbi:MAG: hypothetical protein ACTMKY_10375 [Dermabacteraceae bacterium]